MCPRPTGMTPDETPEEQQPTAAAEPAAADPLENFAVNLARQQAAERGEEEDEGVDEAFIARALAESRRMRQETGKSNQKRAANMAAVADRHGAGGLSAIQAAMQEHAAEVLSPQQLRTTGLDGETEPSVETVAATGPSTDIQ